MPNSNIPNRSLHATYEILAKGLSGNDFNNLTITKPATLSLIQSNGYAIDRVFNDAQTDLQAVGLRSLDPNKPPLLIFAGTTSALDEGENRNPQGAGFTQFDRNRTAIDNWLTAIAQDSTKNPQKLLPDVTGYSLGAALVQWTAAYFANKISEAVTFNSFGLNQGITNIFRQNGGIAAQVTHYVNSGDVVSLQGQEFISGAVILASYTTPLVDPQNLLNKHGDYIVPNSSASQPANLTYQEISTDTFNSPNFNYSDRDWNDFRIAVQTLDNQISQGVSNRQNAENLRKQFSYFQLTAKVDGLNLSSGYASATSSGLRPNPSNNVLQIVNNTSNQNIKFTPIGRAGNAINEIGIFKVDDDRGSINGILPGNAGYVQAALERSQVVFSNLTGSFFNTNTQRQISFNPSDRFQFYSIQNSTTDQARQNLQNGENLPPIIFADPTANGNRVFTKLDIDNGSLRVGWNDNNNSQGNYQDLVLKVEKINTSAPIGSKLQGQLTGEVIDLRDSLGTVRVGVNLRSDAAYNNYFGLYAVDDETGRIGNLNPGDAGYAEAALRRAVVNLNKNQTSTQQQLVGGTLYAPFLVANGSVEDFLSQNPSNTGGDNLPQAYFNYLGANTDRVDHVRLLGDNQFGFEDLLGGGDRDYNDLVVQFNFV
jgi:hypothetical protein